MRSAITDESVSTPAVGATRESFKYQFLITWIEKLKIKKEEVPQLLLFFSIEIGLV